MGNPRLDKHQRKEGYGIPSPHRLEEAALKLLQPAPLRQRVSGKDAFRVIARPGGSLKRLHRPNLLRLDCMGVKDKKTFKIFRGFNPVCPQHGPYEASEGIYSGHGQKKNGGG